MILTKLNRTTTNNNAQNPDAIQESYEHAQTKVNGTKGSCFKGLLTIDQNMDQANSTVHETHAGPS